MFKPTFFDHHKAFAIALSKDNKVSKQIRQGQEIMFMYGTDRELVFKNAFTRESFTLDYQGVEL